MSSSEYFEFVKALAADLNKKAIELPSFPDVVIQVRKALDNPDTTGNDLAKILSLDAVLASGPHSCELDLLQPRWHQDSRVWSRPWAA